MRPSRRGERWHWASSWSWTLSCRETRRWSLAEELAALSSRWAMLCFLRLEMNFCTSFLFLVNPVSSPIQGKEQGTVVSINSATPCKTKTKITGKWFAKFKNFRIYTCTCIQVCNLVSWNFNSFPQMLIIQCLS